MSANTSLSLVSLDFDDNKAALKAFIKNQSIFADYDFDGPNISVLLDILAYNTYLNGFYLNMVASEQFLDSAQLRSSVLSHAKSLNYTPRSKTSSKAKLSVSFPQSGLSTLLIPAGTQFSGLNANNTYTFVTTENVTLYPSGNTFSTDSLYVYEGVTIQDSFVINNNIENQRFILSNKGIDADSLEVTIVEDTVSSIYTKTDSLFDIDSTSKVFFTQATENLNYEIYFGDGVFGYKPKNNALVICTYRVTNGSLGNGVTRFSLNDSLGPVNGYGFDIPATVTTISPSFGGSEEETINSIRFKAPKFYQTQNRAVTTNDFELLVVKQFPDIKAVSVYGGETLDNPVFGTVFVSPVTTTGQLLSDTQKKDIETYLLTKCVPGITPTCVDPAYLYIVVNSLVNYDPSKTKLTSSDIKTLVTSAIQSYSNTYLTNFDSDFKHSQYETIVTSAEASIVSSETTIMMKKQLDIELNSPTLLSFSYNNEFEPGSLYSTKFVSGGRTYILTDFNSLLNTYELRQSELGIKATNSSNRVYLKDLTSPSTVSYIDIGSLNYKTGTISLSPLTISTLLEGAYLDVYVKPVSQNVKAIGNNILDINVSTDITLTVKEVE